MGTGIPTDRLFLIRRRMEFPNDCEQEVKRKKKNKSLIRETMTGKSRSPLLSSGYSFHSCMNSSRNARMYAVRVCASFFPAVVFMVASRWSSFS